MTRPTPRQRWVDSVWESDHLRPHERLVALAFAKYAAKGVDDVWVTFSELRRRTRLSNDAASRALRGLRGGGWLVITQEAAGPRAARYRLTVPGSTPVEGALEQDESTPADGAPDVGSTPISDPKHSDSGPEALRLAESNHKNHEETSPPTPLHEVLGVEPGEVEACLRISAGMGSHSPEARLRKDPDHRRAVVQQHRKEQRATGPRCEDHPEQPASDCPPCMSEVKGTAPRRPREFVGLHWRPPLEATG